MREDYQPRKALNVLLNLLRHRPHNIAVLHKVLGIASNSKAQHCNNVQVLEYWSLAPPANVTARPGITYILARPKTHFVPDAMH